MVTTPKIYTVLTVFNAVVSVICGYWKPLELFRSRFWIILFFLFNLGRLKLLDDRLQCKVENNMWEVLNMDLNKKQAQYKQLRYSNSDTVKATYCTFTERTWGFQHVLHRWSGTEDRRLEVGTQTGDIPYIKENFAEECEGLLKEKNVSEGHCVGKLFT